MKVYYLDQDGRLSGEGDTYSMVPNATTKAPPVIPDGKEAIFNTDLNDWELVDLPVDPAPV
ncbi:hypothetical protein P8629_07035 [Hydrogenovibrio sp. 3SP14C1]|uniref:hypothetical protein n=1 Tax=Hydrogenovibrio sp. 3SP14C1 TaxID=3038774 RepID=UPI002415A7D6|nr:hypothetical protein [Hydrogenovibrio sp. 3SP14C1]MDG4812760.1 hypothetical protein [Hydrogenovibrio sp. 3SP14C1]